MTRSTQIIAASVVTAVASALLWLGAPTVPAIVGACTAGAVLWWGNRGATEVRAVCRVADVRAHRAPLGRKAR